MRLSHKIFISFFLTTLVLGSALIWLGYSHVRDQTNEEFTSRYQVFSKVMGDTLTRLDKSTESLMLNAVKVVAARDLAEGLLSTESLKAMRSELSMTHIFVVDKVGKFIRSTNEDPKLIPNAFSFCSKYKDMAVGRSNLEATPIIHPNPEPKPYKFLFIPNHNRERLLEVGVRVDFVAKTLTEALGSDNNIVSMSLYAPNGVSFGRFNSKGVDFKDVKMDLPAVFPSMIDAGSNLRFFTKVESSHPSCCQCDVSGTSKNGEYYYVLESEVSKSELSALQATTRNIFIGLAFGNLIFAILLSQLLSRRLVRNIEVAVAKIRQVKKNGDLKSRLNLGGKDEVAFLTKEFDRLLDTIEDSHAKIIEAEKLQIKVQLAKEVAHNINSPIVAIEMMMPLMARLPERIQKVLRNSVREIKTLSERLSRKADSLSGESNLSPLPREVVLLQHLIEETIQEKQMEFSRFPGIEITAKCEEGLSGAATLADSVELKSVISNLVNNAAEAYSDKKGSILVFLKLDSDGFSIEVTDRGRGMSSEVLSQLGNTVVSEGKNNGKGLGLMHAFKVVKAWGGIVEVDSSPGAGTKVTLKLRRMQQVPTVDLANEEKPIQL